MRPPTALGLSPPGESIVERSALARTDAVAGKRQARSTRGEEAGMRVWFQEDQAGELGLRTTC